MIKVGLGLFIAAVAFRFCCTTVFSDIESADYAKLVTFTNVLAVGGFGALALAIIIFVNRKSE